MMTRQERARQFAPFDAMKGLQEALRKREEIHDRVEKHGISDEEAEKVSRVLKSLSRGMSVRVSCYHAFHDVIIYGRVDEIDYNYRRLSVDGEQILFEDIYRINITGYNA